MCTPTRQIRALFDDNTIRVYQAYSPSIADPAIKAGRFVSPPFKMDRMTWIKPSFFWMMYRCGWATKPGQERVLAIDITRDGFEWALAHSCLSHYEPEVHGTRQNWEELKAVMPVRVQWDPERDSRLNKMEYRSIQIGLAGEAVARYVGQWIQKITDITYMTEDRQVIEKSSRFPPEIPYLIPAELAKIIGA